jgi:hypothetical protein
MAIKPQVFELDDDAGVIGTLYDPIPNEAYTVAGQGEETAQAEREATRELRAHWQDRSVEEDKSAGSGGKSKSSKSSSSSGSSSSSSSSSS